EIINFEKL
nr:Chain C, Ovalbumin epitope, EIINFEKL [synthetic construct]3PAB_F Chain F, Ovalbumin epitope, EIINFEKL [synthetic construct]